MGKATPHAAASGPALHSRRPALVEAILPVNSHVPGFPGESADFRVSLKHNLPRLSFLKSMRLRQLVSGQVPN